MPGARSTSSSTSYLKFAAPVVRRNAGVCKHTTAAALRKGRSPFARSRRASRAACSTPPAPARHHRHGPSFAFMRATRRRKSRGVVDAWYRGARGVTGHIASRITFCTRVKWRTSFGPRVRVSQICKSSLVCRIGSPISKLNLSHETYHIARRVMCVCGKGVCSESRGSGHV